MPDSPRSTDDVAVPSLGCSRPAAVRIFIDDQQSATPAERLIVGDSPKIRLAFHELDVEETLATSGVDEGDQAGALTILVFLPSGSRTPFLLQKRAEDWMAARGEERGAPYEVAWRSDRILWRRGRALCVGGGEFLRDIRAAIAFFSYYERDLAGLEDRVASTWPAVEGDLALTHSVARRELRRQNAIDERTREAHAMRLDFIRLGSALERPDRVLSAPAQRIVTELALQADATDRLRLLDDGIEFVQETYDTVNDRLLEFRYFRTEYRIEVLIAVILLAELVAVCVEIWQNG